MKQNGVLRREHKTGGGGLRGRLKHMTRSAAVPFNKCVLPLGAAITALHQRSRRSDTVLTGTEKHSGGEVERGKEGQGERHR